MIAPDLAATYRAYIDCLNRQDWAELGRFVSNDVQHNGRNIGLVGYREMLEENYRSIPDLRFEIDLLVCEPPHVASRLNFNCSPTGDFLGLTIDGRKVSFTENVFYKFTDDRIEEVWSIIDKAAIETQL